MTVVVGYVPDDTGVLAVREAAQQALWRDTDVVVVNVVDASGYTRPTAADEKELDAIEADLTSKGVRFSTRHIEDTTVRASERILAVAEEVGAELVVVGIKRRSAVAKAVLGSTAQRVITGATCPVLTVRAEN